MKSTDNSTIMNNINDTEETLCEAFEKTKISYDEQSLEVLEVLEVASQKTVKRKPGRPRKHDLKPSVKDVPIGYDFEKATVTTKTFTIKVENFDADINVWQNIIMLSESDNKEPGSVVDKYVLSRKNAKNAEKKENVFKNCFTVVVLDQSLKATTIKICKKGSFQLTGCKSMESGEFCVLSLLTNLWKFNPESVPRIIDMTIKPVMTNVKFTIGYKISIKNALDFFENRKEIHGFFSYKLRVNPAINIKQLLCDSDLDKVPVRNVIVDRKNGPPLLKEKMVDRMVSEITLSQHIQALPQKERQKHFKEKHTTLLLFRSGSVILSGIHENIMKKTFEIFQNVTTEYKELLQ